MNPLRDKIVQLIHFQKEITIRLHIELVEKINSTGTTDYLKIAMVLREAVKNYLAENHFAKKPLAERVFWPKIAVS